MTPMLSDWFLQSGLNTQNSFCGPMSDMWIVANQGLSREQRTASRTDFACFVVAWWMAYPRPKPGKFAGPQGIVPVSVRQVP